MFKQLIGITGFFLIFSCTNSVPEIPEHKIIAKVGTDILSTDQLETVVARFNRMIVADDVKNKYIKKWVSSSILYQEALKSGYQLTENDKFKIEQLKKDLIIQQFLDNRLKEVEVLDNDIKSYYALNQEEFKREENEIRLAHLRLETKVQAIFEEIKQTTSILKTVQKFHLEKQKDGKMIIGDLGYVKESEINPVFLEQLVKAQKRKGNRRNPKYKTGDVIGPFKLKSGYHFIQVIDQKNKGTYYPVEQVKEDIRQRLFIQKLDEYQQQLIEELKKNYHIINQLNKG